MNRFNKFLSFLEDPKSLNTEELQFIREQIDNYPHVFALMFHSFGSSYYEINFDLMEDRESCIQVMKSPIFYQGGLKTTESKPSGRWKVFEIENIECFIMNLASTIRANRITCQYLTSVELQNKAKSANYIKKLLKKLKSEIKYLPDLDLLLQKQVSLFTKQIDDIENIINNKVGEIGRATARELIFFGKLFDKRIEELACVFWNYAPEIKFNPLVKRIEELIKFLNFGSHTSSSIKKKLQRAKLTEPPDMLSKPYYSPNLVKKVERYTKDL